MDSTNQSDRSEAPGAQLMPQLSVDDPHAVQRRAVAAGASEIRPVGEEHGWLVGRIADPYGHHWEIAKPPVDAP